MSRKKYFLCLIMLAVSLHAVAQNWDINITKSINPQNPSSGYWKTTSGSVYFLSGAVPIYFLARGIIKNDFSLKQKAYDVFGAIAVELILSEALKESINRHRPAETYPKLINQYRNVSGKSFPSGHTSLAFATAAGLSIQCKKWYVVVPAYAWASSVGYSRIYLGVHYVSDVVAGAAVGIGSAYLRHWLNRKLFKRGKL